MLRTGARLAAWGLVWSLALTAAAEPMEASRLVLPGRIQDLDAADVDGDGRADVLVIWASGEDFQTRTRLSIFRARKEGYPERPDQVVSLPAGTVAYDLADANGDGRCDVLLLAGDGVRMLAAGADGKLGREPVELLRVMCTAAFPQPGAVPRMRFGLQLDTRPALLLPTVPIGPLTLYTPGADGRFAQQRSLRVPTRAAIHAAGGGAGLAPAGDRFVFQYPARALADWDGDGLVDLFFMEGGSLAVFRQRPDAGFASEPDVYQRLQGRSQPGDKSLSMLRGAVGDLDGDGKAEVAAVSLSAKGMTDVASQVQIFKAGSEGKYIKSQEFKGAAGLPIFGGGLLLEDVDGDGRRDVLLPNADVGLSDLLGMAIRKGGTVDMRVDVFLSTADGVRPRADIRIECPIAFDMESKKQSGLDLPVLGHDFDGDGKPDLAIRIAGGGAGDRPDRVELRPGRGESGFGEAVWKTMLPPVKRMKAFPARAGRSGLLVELAGSGEQGDVVVLDNRGPWRRSP
ncbi:MAG: VCBS repeat-containing protein [Deltaproteobacteria bacterium]|nr:VCBS repeat-containing protein [Deltaproteobacteria bacterium]